MEFIPIIILKNHKIYATSDNETSSLEELFKIIDPEMPSLYIYDEDGIEKDEPNLSLFQKISEHINLWIDSGPRTHGDVVDVFMTGANNITLSKKLFPNVDVTVIREITENNIFFSIDIEEGGALLESNSYQNSDGLVLFHDKNQIEKEFNSGLFLKNLCKKYKVYVYETEAKNTSYWADKGIRGLLVPVNKPKEFAKAWKMKQKLSSNFYTKGVEKPY